MISSSIPSFKVNKKKRKERNKIIINKTKGKNKKYLACRH